MVLVGRTLEKCSRTVEEIQSFSGTAMAFACDVSKRDQVDEVVKNTIDAFGSIHVLVNNAHASRPMVSLIDTTEKDMAVSQKGMYGTYHFMQACCPFLARRSDGIDSTLRAFSSTRAI